MTLIIPNADARLLNIITAINALNPHPYTVVEKEDYPQELLDSIAEGERELEEQRANGTLKTYATAQELFADIV